MSARANRLVLTFVGLFLLVGGGLSVCLGAGVFDAARADRPVFDRTLIRWWDEGGWRSYAVVDAIGAAALILGLLLAWSQLRRRSGGKRAADLTLPAADRHGRTTLRTSALSNVLQADLEAIPAVHDAVVGLYGTYPRLAMRSTLTLSDGADLDQIPHQVDTVLARVETTTGTRPEPVHITVRWKATDRQRQLQ